MRRKRILLIAVFFFAIILLSNRVQAVTCTLDAECDRMSYTASSSYLYGDNFDNNPNVSCTVEVPLSCKIDGNMTYFDDYFMYAINNWAMYSNGYYCLLYIAGFDSLENLTVSSNGYTFYNNSNEDITIFYCDRYFSRRTGELLGTSYGSFSGHNYNSCTLATISAHSSFQFNSSYSGYYSKNYCFSTFDVYEQGTGNLVYGASIIFEPPVVYESPTLYIDDHNLRKRFKFQFNIPMIREDTKYYVFLEDYKRLSYDSVEGTFRIYTVTTPEGYDYTDYENYMYYDKDLKNTDLVLPAGCEIHEYACVLDNDIVGELNEIQSYTASRFITLSGYAADLFYTFIDLNYFDENTFFTYLFPTDFTFETSGGYSFSSLFYRAFNTLTLTTYRHGLEFFYSKYFDNVSISSFNDLAFYSHLFYYYYSDFISYNFFNFSFSDFCFSNYKIVSYQKQKLDTEIGVDIPVYSVFRKTTIYNKNNMISNNVFVHNYSDGEDVSSLLPSGTDTDYLTSPLLRDNEKSSSGGYITYDIREVIQGDKNIDYSKEDNSIHNEFNGDYIENFNEGDNITINNEYTEIVEKTSDEYLLHNIYVVLLEIRTILWSMGDSVSNYTNNFTYNIENNVNYYLVPQKNQMNIITNEFDYTAKSHLGIIYTPIEFLVYTFNLFANMDNDTDIVFHTPQIEFKGVVLVPELQTNVTALMYEQIPALRKCSPYCFDFYGFCYYYVCCKIC